MRAKPPSASFQTSPPGPACAQFSRSASEPRIVCSETYSWNGPPSTENSVLATPEPSPSSASSVTSKGPSPSVVAVVSGGVESILRSSDLVASTLPSTSVER